MDAHYDRGAGGFAVFESEGSLVDGVGIFFVESLVFLLSLWHVVFDKVLILMIITLEHKRTTCLKQQREVSKNAFRWQHMKCILIISVFVFGVHVNTDDAVDYEIDGAEFLLWFDDALFIGYNL